MLRARSVLVGLVAVLSVGGMLVSSASAINFEWRVTGTKLEAGESKEFTVSTDGKNFDFHGSVGGLAILFLSHEASVLSGAKLIGGIPGTGESTIVQKGTTFDPPLQTCGVIQAGGAAGEIKTVPIKTEIVEGAPGGVGNGEALVLFTPRVGETFETWELTGESCPDKGAVIAVTGLFLGLPLPQKTEVVRQNLVFEANTKEYKNHAGEIKAAGLKSAGNAATFTGLGLVVLTSGQAYAPF